MALVGIYLTFICLITPHNVWSQTYIYWVNSGANKIQRANLDGTNVTDVIDVSTGTIDVAVDATNEKIYWTVSNDKIQRANLDGSSIENIVTGLSANSFIALEVNNNRIYWSEESSPGRISRANLDGTNPIALITANAEVKFPKFIALDLVNDKIFYRSNTPANTDYMVRRGNLNGTGIEANYITGLLNTGIEGIAVDPNGSRIYWAGENSDDISRANLDGTGVTQLIVGLDHPRGIAIDFSNNKIYWCDAGTNKIQRANISDGSAVEDIVTGLNTPIGITIATILNASGEEGNIRYVPFSSKYILMVLMALLGGWFVSRLR